MQTNALDSSVTWIGNSIKYSFYLAIRSTQQLLQQHNEPQDSEKK
jgi:hypothetical protein